MPSQFPLFSSSSLLLCLLTADNCMCRDSVVWLAKGGQQNRNTAAQDEDCVWSRGNNIRCRGPGEDLIIDRNLSCIASFSSVPSLFCCSEADLDRYTFIHFDSITRTSQNQRSNSNNRASLIAYNFNILYGHSQPCYRSLGVL